MIKKKRGFLRARLREQEDESSGTDVREINTNQLSEAGEKRQRKGSNRGSLCCRKLKVSTEVEPCLAD